MASGADSLRPLLLLQSLEYPGWPNLKFCELARQAGFRTISVRRPGFGNIREPASLDEQVSLIGLFLEAQRRGDAVVACLGTSNTLGYRLASHPAVGLTVLGNCCFNHYPMAEIRPDWFARHMEQTLTSVGGARLALMGLKGAQAVFGKFWVTENFMQKSEGDLEYLHDNHDLFEEAMDCILAGMEIHTFIQELSSTLKQDPFLTDGCFEGLPVISVSGVETSETWQSAIRAEAERVGAPLHFFPSGDALVLHQCPHELMKLISGHA